MTDSMFTEYAYIPPHKRRGFKPACAVLAETTSTSTPLSTHKPASLVSYSDISVDGGVATQKDTSDQFSSAQQTTTQPISTKMPSQAKPGAEEKNRRASKWPHPSEIKAQRHTRRRSFDSDDGHDAGVQLDESVQNGPDQLADFTGGWGPAPASWDFRPAFRDHQSNKRMEEWNADAFPQTQKQEVAIPFELTINLSGQSQLFRFSGEIAPSQTGQRQPKIGTSSSSKPPSGRQLESANTSQSLVMGDMVPRQWIPVTLEANQSPQAFWYYHHTSPPNPLDDEDLVNVRPWWDSYPDPTACFHLALEQPPTSGITRGDESPEEYRARQADHGSNTAVSRFLANRKRRNARKAGNNPTLELAAPPTETLPTPADTFVPQANVELSPGVSMYLREAVPCDSTQMTHIYNRLAKTNVSIPDCESLTNNYFTDRLRIVRSVNLPFFVACEPAAKDGKHKAESGTDKIIGIALAEDFTDHVGMYRFTATIEIYVHRDYHRKSVAKCLMDKMLFLLDPDYIEKGGYEVRGIDLTLGPQRTIQKIIINMPFVEGEQPEWLSKWLEDCKFSKAAVLKGMGCKLGKSVDLAMFERKTGTKIDPKNPPISMGD